MDFIVTTVHKPSEQIICAAHKAAEKLRTIYQDRENYSLIKLREMFGVDNILVYGTQGPSIVTTSGEYFFHLNMAQLRIKNLLKGKPDHMVSSMELKPGMTVLDCTLGLATDAIVTSFVLGNSGRITGLESSKIIAFITAYGLKHFTAKTAELTMALRRITAVHADYNEYLAQARDRSFDIVYLDPMFRHPIKKSSNFQPLRTITDNRPISLGTLQQACRIARKKVVIKETNGSNEFTRLRINKVIGGRYSSVQYGVIEVGNEWIN